MKFTPKKKEQYFMINSRFEVAVSSNGGGHKSNARIAAGNCFRTRPEAELFLEKIKSNLPKKPWWRFW